MTVALRTSRLARAALLAAAALAAARPAAAQVGRDTLLARPLTIGDAARLAARQSAAVQGARLRTEQAEARVTQRRAELYPNVSALASQGGHTLNSASFGLDFPTPAGQKPFLDPNGQVIGPVYLTDVRGRVSQSLYDASSRARIRSAEAGVRASTAEATSVSEQAAAAAAAAYLRTQRAAAQLQARVADSALADSLLGIAREQLRAGVGVALDVTRAQSQLAAIRAQLIAARNEIDRARLDLLRTLGVPLSAPVRLADSLLALPVSDTIPDEAAAVARALQRRPDLRAAAAQLQAAERQVAAIRAERLPSVGLFADEGVNGKSPAHLLNTYTWGLQLSVPIFEGFRREGRTEEQRAVAREIDVRRRDLELQAQVEVRGALLDLASAREQVEAARERLRLAEQEVAQARDRFRAGVAGNADVISASFSLNGARTTLIDALTAYESARVAFARAEGAVTELP